MTDIAKATRASIPVGTVAIDGFMLPDGSYRMSQAQAAEAIGDPPVYALRFLQSKDSKAILGEGYTDYTPESVEVEPDQNKRGQTRINALPLKVVTAYWLTRAYKGNQKAFILSWALLTETLESRFDAAFGVKRSEEERNERLIQQMQQLEEDLTKLGEAFALEDSIRQERDYFERLLRENGIDPWALPSDEAEGDRQ